MLSSLSLIDTALSLAIISVFLIAIEFFTIRFNIPRVHARKIVHTGSALLIVLVALLFDWRLFILLGPLFFVVLILARRFHPLESLRDRSDESFGEILFPFGVTVAVLLCPTQITFIIAVLILGISDTAAFYIGRAIKSPRLLHKKSVAGSLAFLVTAFVIALLSANLPLALGMAVATTLVELASPKGTDNLFIPSVAALLFMFFS